MHLGFARRAFLLSADACVYSPIPNRTCHVERSGVSDRSYSLSEITSSMSIQILHFAQDGYIARTQAAGAYCVGCKTNAYVLRLTSKTCSRVRSLPNLRARLAPIVDGRWLIVNPLTSCSTASSHMDAGDG